MCTHYVVMNLKWKHMECSDCLHLPYTWNFQYQFFKNTPYRDLILDRWNKWKHRFENFITKVLTKYSYELLNE
jgi:hypothetical protein